ncbi:expressed unknown protein [Seminavis robusta]|uniref:Uncharacterized protein n=1 Tax=Seminavis robusta TaxID=568900 RepID=A0A9N8EIY6_9STRA|nr:expressed unknown protein [Seminavis robusta]|eukprot:Sro1276_g258530.1 n/a (498) ;mRNA; f:3290-4783
MSSTPALTRKPGTGLFVDTKTDFCIALSERADGLLETSKAIKEIQTVLLDSSASNDEKTKAADNLTILINYLQQENAKLQKDVRAMAPISGFNRGYQRIAAANRQAMRKQGRMTSLQKVETLIDEDENNNNTGNASASSSKKPKATAAATTPTPTTETPTPTKVIPDKDATINFPPPANGETYTRHECIQVVENLQGTAAKGKIIEALLKSSYIPVKHSALYRMLKNWKEHKAAGFTLHSFPNDSWFNLGRPPHALIFDEVEGIVRKLPTKPGKTNEQLNQQMDSRKRKKSEASGKVALSESSSAYSKKLKATSAATPATTTPTTTNIIPHATLPPPANGKTYTRHECIQVVEKLQGTAGTTKGKIIADILQSSYIPVKKAALYEMLKRWKQHKKAGGTLETFPNYDWLNYGRPPFLSLNEVEGIAQELSTTPGKAIDLEELKQKMVRRKREKLEASGKVLPSESAATPSRDTLRNYGIQLRLIGGASCPTNSSKKT